MERLTIHMEQQDGIVTHFRTVLETLQANSGTDTAMTSLRVSEDVFARTVASTATYLIPAGAA